MSTSETLSPVVAFGPKRYFNRELSWLEFNTRVLEEAEDPSNRLMERLKFLAITSSNLDEFFMVRIAGLREQTFGDQAPQDVSADGMSSSEQMHLCAQRTHDLVAAQYRCWNQELRPQLLDNGIEFAAQDSLSELEVERLDRFFTDRAFPVLTPMAIDPSHPSPLFHNRGLYIGTLLERRAELGPKRLFAVVQLPALLPRFVRVSGDETSRVRFVLLEDAIASRLPQLFGDCRVLAWTTFRITRDSDLELLHEESDDMLSLIESRLKARRRGDAVRLEVSADADERIVRQIVELEHVHDDPEFREVYRVDGPVDLTDLWQIVKLPGFAQLRDEPYTPRVPRGLEGPRGADLFAAIRARDILLHHPFDSFDPVVEFTTSAARDPQVVAVKQTLYRTGGDSPIVRALIEAAEQGKHVTALVELKARFDEATNVGWARKMERAGVHVVFGFLDLKTHGKVSMVVRQEGETLRRYVHLATGNYNPSTARLYTDIGLFTANEDIATDATAVFNLLTGYTQGHRWRQLVVAPSHLHNRTIELIDEQAALAARGEPAYIFGKSNSLVDPAVIDALYRASHAGVKIDLVIRGICCLRPGLPDLSENIHVRSIVGRYLEHSRIFVFGPAEDPLCRIFASSADWMPRNFHRRVEIMFPILDPKLRSQILDEILPIYMQDNARARVLQPDGAYQRLRPPTEEDTIDCQIELMKR